MVDHSERKPTVLKDKDIVTAKKVSRRSLLASAGVAAGVAGLVVAGTQKALAKDQKQADMRDRTPPKIDGSRDTD